MSFVCRDLKPLQSEYPREELKRDRKIMAKNSYLMKLLEDKNQDTWKHLLKSRLTPFEETTVIDDVTKAKENEVLNREILSKNELNNHYTKEDMIKILKPYLIDPTHISGCVVTVLPVHVYYDNVAVQKPIKQLNERKPWGIPMEENKKLKCAKWITPDSIKSKQLLSRTEMEITALLKRENQEPKFSLKYIWSVLYNKNFDIHQLKTIGKFRKKLYCKN